MADDGFDFLRTTKPGFVNASAGFTFFESLLGRALN